MKKMTTNLANIRKMVEEVCTDPGIPEELKAEFAEFWQTVHRAADKLDQQIELFCGE